MEQVNLKLKIITDFLNQMEIDYEIKVRNRKGNKFYEFLCLGDKYIRLYICEIAEVYTSSEYCNYTYKALGTFGELDIIRELRKGLEIEDKPYKMDQRNLDKMLNSFGPGMSSKILDSLESYKNISNMKTLVNKVLEMCPEQLKAEYVEFKQLEIGQEIQIKNVKRTYHNPRMNPLKGKTGTITHLSESGLEAKIKVPGSSDELYWYFTYLDY